MSIHRIYLEVPELGGTVTSLINPMANSRSAITRLAQYLDGIANGAKNGKLRLNIDAVQSSATVTFASFADADTVTLNGVTLTGKTSPSTSVQWAVGASNEACANNFATLINASASNKIVGVISAKRRATIALSSFVDADTITINGVVFTGKTTPTVGTREHFAIGASDTITGDKLVAAIGSSLDARIAGITASNSSGTVTLNYSGSLTVSASAHATVNSDIVVLTSIVGGQIGNLCTLAISAHGSVSGAAFTGGTEGTETVIAVTY